MFYSIRKDDVNKTIVELKAEVKESQFEQMKLSSAVSGLEVFRMNMSMNQCGMFMLLEYMLEIKRNAGK
jgi:hypothetical protein